MGDLAGSVGLILSRVERRVEVSSQNIANAATPGYKRTISFDSMLDARDGADSSAVNGEVPVGVHTRLGIDLTPGQPQMTHNPDDLALLGGGFFAVRSADGATLYTRQGQFRRDSDGHLVNARNCVLQQRGGGDLMLQSGDFKVLDDGTVLQAGQAVGRIAVVGLSDPTAIAYAEGGQYSAPDDAVATMDAPSVLQGGLEASNVSMGSEMVTMMAALREAQSGQRLMGVYDDLMGRAITTFGQG